MKKDNPIVIFKYTDGSARRIVSFEEIVSNIGFEYGIPDPTWRLTSEESYIDEIEINGVVAWKRVR